MTTIEYGGGPEIDQKREFTGLKEDAHIPGYQGHCPQLKFSIGKTYGQETSDLAKIRRCHRHQMKDTEVTEGLPKLHHSWSWNLPESSGDNKYMENMVPGYTGYVPRWPFKFGKRYKEECDVCLAEFLAGRQMQEQTEQEVRSLSKSLPSLKAVQNDPQVRDHLNSFGEKNIGTSILSQHRRQQTEAPMPGYRGYIPRIRTTELGLGCRYHDMTKNGLDAFYTTRAQREHKLGPLPDMFGAHRLEPITVKRNTSSSSREYGPRLYIQDGMIPKYTGYIPQQSYAVGNTFGDETRSLEACAHDQRCYGDYLKLQRSQQLSA